MTRYVAALGGAGLLTGAVVMGSPLIWPPDPDASLVLRNGQFVGEVLGYVWAVEPDTATIEVSSSLVGLHAFPVTVDAKTRITEGEKEGAFGDLARNRRVRIVYAVREQERVAASIELLRQGDSGSARPATLLSNETEAPPPYWVEVGLFSDAGAADALISRLLEHNLTVSLESVTLRGGRERALRVRVGPFSDEAAATAAKHNLHAIGYQARALW